MPKALARLATSMPMRPSPTIPSVLPRPANPEFLAIPLSGRQAGMGGPRCATRPNSNVIACSAVLIVLPAGVFITTMPRRVAAALSMLSVPTPARTMALSRLVAFQRLGCDFHATSADGTFVFLQRFA